MIFQLVTQHINRIDTPYNRSTDNKIESIKNINLGVFESDYKPQAKEIIRFKNKDYEVEKVIRIISENRTSTYEQFFVQVIPYSTKKLVCFGSDSWTEDIPLPIPGPNGI